jgi:acyl-CoA thioester hydrolase
MAIHHHEVRIYYEDTDLSGLVYHANYLKYFERAREHLIGGEELVRLYDDEGVGFVVYKVGLTFREGARLGDILDIRTSVEVDGRYRAIFHQAAWRPDGEQPMVSGEVQLACTGRDLKLVPLPKSVIDGVARFADE